MAKKTKLGIGSYIRQHILPVGMTVAAAAERLGVGRPALSNLLNGNATLTPEMAHRLKEAFDADADALLKLQAETQGSDPETAKRVLVRGYAPRFLSIKALAIEGWARTIEARTLLPVLLRRLIHSTGRDLLVVDFPGYDNAERHGSDGFVEVNAGTAWIPAGRSYWEFGVNEDVRRKADSDYAARTNSVPKEERLRSTYVQVTPRNWKAKKNWEASKNAQGQWKAVRIYDASDLEQWLEESIPAQMWVAERLDLPREGEDFQTLDSFWQRWAQVSDPPMPAELFASAITDHASSFEGWLGQPPDEPLVIAADSQGEALAFLACLLEARRAEKPQIDAAADGAVIFRSGSTLAKLVAASTNFLPIATTIAAEQELAPLLRRRYCVIVRPLNAVDRKPDIALTPLSPEAFTAALSATNSREEIERLGRECGYSPTILRRLRSPLDAMRQPAWATDTRIARALVPVALVGAWHVAASADQDVVSKLAARSHDDVESDIAAMLPLDDTPVWSLSEYRGVISKKDALFAIARHVTRADLERFIDIAHAVLSEPDPALELPEDKRWLAAIYNKKRQHSAALRSGVCETLVLLTVHGNDLFKARTGFDSEVAVARLVERLLTPLTLESLQSQEADLRRYAEAAPEIFLAILENDLKQDEPVLLGLLRPADRGPFGHPLRTGLLWALEGLAWNPRTLRRVVTILGRLSLIPIEDNWVNKPISSLQMILSAWLPQTAAPLEQRQQVLRLLAKDYPEVGWMLCTDQFQFGPRIGHHSHRPEWRGDASGAGGPVPEDEVFAFAETAVELALAWRDHTAETLGDLVRSLPNLPDTHAKRVWDSILAWSATANDPQKAVLREKVREFALTVRAQRRGLAEPFRDRAKEAYDALTPSDLVVRHGWLFKKAWVEESADELEDESLDRLAREQRIEKQRGQAIAEIWAERRLDGVLALIADSDAPAMIGWFTAGLIADPVKIRAALQHCLTLDSKEFSKVDQFASGFAYAIGPDKRAVVLPVLLSEAPEEQRTRILQWFPFSSETWRQVDRQSDTVQTAYWNTISVGVPRDLSDAETNEAIQCLLRARRPRTAFGMVQYDWQRLETDQIRQILTAVATVENEAERTLAIDQWAVSEALSELEKRPGVTSEEMARLEFFYLDALEHTEHGIENLEEQLSRMPALFVQAVCLAFKRRDGADDPPELQLSTDEHRAAAQNALELLRRTTRLPGRTKDGVIEVGNLNSWLSEVRSLCAEFGRTVIGDQMIGQLFAHAPTDPEGLWPARPVCEALEAVASEDIAAGFRMGVLNARSVAWRRRDGGASERAQAAEYRQQAERLGTEFPFVSRMVESIAETYEWRAEREDSEADVRRRLRQ